MNSLSLTSPQFNELSIQRTVSQLPSPQKQCQPSDYNDGLFGKTFTMQPSTEYFLSNPFESGKNLEILYVCNGFRPWEIDSRLCQLCLMFKDELFSVCH